MLEYLLFASFGLVGLFLGGEWLVIGTARLARSFGISTLIIGLTVVAFGTSTPELLVSMNAVLSGISDISIGNVIGSNIANIGLILGATGLVFPIVVHGTLLRREIPILMIVTLATALIVADGDVDQGDGIILVAGLVIFNVGMIFFAHHDRKRGQRIAEQSDIDMEDDIPPTLRGRGWELLRIGAGVTILLIAAQMTVHGAVGIAREVGISELAIGITLVALGTSLPELATSLVAAFRKQSDIAIGNIVGSNIYNLLGILGITALVRPIEVAPQVIYFDGPVMIGFTLMLFPLVLNRVISRMEAVLLLGAYMAFILITLLS